MAAFSHVPVLLDETLEGLRIRPDGIYLDGTVGGAGHSGEIARRLGPEGKLFCFDKDPETAGYFQSFPHWGKTLLLFG